MNKSDHIAKSDFEISWVNFLKNSHLSLVHLSNICNSKHRLTSLSISVLFFFCQTISSFHLKNIYKFRNFHHLWSMSYGPQVMVHELKDLSKLTLVLTLVSRLVSFLASLEAIIAAKCIDFFLSAAFNLGKYMNSAKSIGSMSSLDSKNSSAAVEPASRQLHWRRGR